MKLFVHFLDSDLIDIICSKRMTVQYHRKWWEESRGLGYLSTPGMEKISSAIMQ